MWSLNKKEIVISCDMCKSFTKEKMGLEFQNWVKRARESGWVVVVSSPVPWGGLALCPKCAEKFNTDLGVKIKPVLELVKKNNPITVIEVFLNLMREFAYNILDQTDENKPIPETEIEKVECSEPSVKEQKE